MAILVLCVSAVVSMVPARDVARAAAAFPAGQLALAAAVFVVVHVLRSWRYALLVGDLRLRVAVSTCAVGFLAVNTLPFRLGEAVRPALLARRGLPLAHAVSAVAIERLFDLFGMLLLIGLAAATLGRGAPAATGVGATAAVAVALTLALTRWGQAGADALGRAGWHRVGRAFGALAAHLGSVGSRTLVLSGLLTAGVWLGSAAWLNVQLRAIPGLPSGVGPASAAWAATLLGMSVAPTPGFVGAFEAAMAGTLVGLGATAADAGAAAVLIHVHHLASNAVLGLLGALFEAVSAVRAKREPAGD